MELFEDYRKEYLKVEKEEYIEATKLSSWKKKPFHDDAWIFNDMEYGGDQILRGTVFTKYKQFIQNCFQVLPRQALHAKTLGFVHPLTGKEITFDTQLPDDMQSVLEKWRRYTGSREDHLS